MEIELEINGFNLKACFSHKEIQEVHIRLLKKFTALREEKGERIIVFLAAPPATGKTTLATFLEGLSKEKSGIIPIQSVSLDGFHYDNDYLKSNKFNSHGKEHSLYEIKGMPETFDLQNFKNYVSRLENENIKWPIYDRNLHNPVMDAVEITADIVLIEGNWLLLDEEGWRDLKQYCDYSVFIESKEALLKDRLIQRKIKGGLTEEEALKFYERTDGKNVSDGNE